MRLSRAAPAIGALLALFCACKTASPTPAVSPPRARACPLGPVQRVAADSITVATTTPVAARHAPGPTNLGERFVFAQLYETLIAVDCDGTARPGLAKSWTVDATKTRVTLVLRDGAQFWNGDAVTARDVVAAWQATADSNQIAKRLADATTIVDDRTLTVSLPNTDTLVLADPSLAIYRRRTGESWPEGTGSYRAGEPARDVAPGQLALLPADRTAPRLVIRSGPDARDAIDAGVDLLLTADPVGLSYASTRPEYTSVPLPWNRTYALAVPNRSTSMGIDALLQAGDSATAFRASLARDAVRADARPAESPVWWAQRCENTQAPAPPFAIRRSPRIVYRADDAVARGLAERLVAVGRVATAAPLSPAEFSRAFRAGSELAYVIALPRTSLAPCFDIAALLSSAPWLGGTISDALIPLIDTRNKAVMRQDRVSASVDWDGTLRMSDRP